MLVPRLYWRGRLFKQADWPETENGGHKTGQVNPFLAHGAEPKKIIMTLEGLVGSTTLTHICKITRPCLIAHLSIHHLRGGAPSNCDPQEHDLCSTPAILTLENMSLYILDTQEHVGMFQLSHAVRFRSPKRRLQSGLWHDAVFVIIF